MKKRLLSVVLAAAMAASLAGCVQKPGASGNTGQGLAAVKKSVEQAVGSDIIFGGQ